MSRTAAILLALAALHAADAGAQMAIARLSGSIAYVTGPITGWVAYIDISGGRMQPVVTPPLASGACLPTQVVQLQSTPDFASRQQTVFSINANLGPEAPPYKPGTCGSPYGMLVSNGAVVNAPEQNGPALVFTGNSSATIGLVSSVGAATYAVAGYAGANGGGTLLVVPPKVPGQPPTPGTNALPAPGIIAPRIGAGITADGKTLIFAMVDGIENANGLQNPDFANVMIGLGANAAVNLDGGGSSTFVFTPGKATLTTPPALSALVKAAAAPPGAGNQLAFGLASLALDKQWISAPPCVQPCTYRAIYANIGFTLAP